MELHSLAGKKAPRELLANIPRLAAFLDRAAAAGIRPRLRHAAATYELHRVPEAHLEPSAWATPCSVRLLGLTSRTRSMPGLCFA